MSALGPLTEHSPPTQPQADMSSSSSSSPHDSTNRAKRALFGAGG
jgi:hypothetical protein